MFVVIFEVQPRKERWDDYLALAKQLKPKLEAIDGFIDNERFHSKRTEGRLLSLSTWRDEKAVIRWRTHGEHHGVQEKAASKCSRTTTCASAEVTADTCPPHGMRISQQRLDETEIGAARAVTITEVTRSDGARDLVAALGLDPSAQRPRGSRVVRKQSTTPARFCCLPPGATPAPPALGSPPRSRAAQPLRHRQVRVVRDYGMFDRREAPQFYPEVKRRS